MSSRHTLLGTDQSGVRNVFAGATVYTLASQADPFMGTLRLAISGSAGTNPTSWIVRVQQGIWSEEWVGTTVGGTSIALVLSELFFVSGEAITVTLENTATADIAVTVDASLFTEINALTTLGTNAPASWIDPAAIADGAITNAKLADGAISVGKIADNAITAAKIASDAITAAKIAANAITDAKINAGAITAAKIAANAITVTQIADNAITAPKIAADAITSAKIAANAITDTKIASGTLTAAKFAAGAFDAVWSVTIRTLSTVGNSSGVTTLLERITGLLRTKAQDDAADEALVLDLLNKEAIGTATVLSGSTASVMIETLNAELLLPNHLKGCLFVITDITNGNEQVRWIASHLSDLDTGYMVITPDEAFTFTPAVGDTIKVYRLARLSPDEADTDPLGVAVPGSYAPGTVGYLIGTNLDVPVSDVAAAAGDATAANQAAILAAIQGTEVLQVASPNVLGNLVLTQGDTYDGIGNPKAQWTVATDYTDGWTVTFTIRDEDDVVVYAETGSVASSTLITVDIDAPTGLAFSGCPGVWQGKFDVQLTKAGSVQTIALGKVFINEDQTR